MAAAPKKPVTPKVAPKPEPEKPKTFCDLLNEKKKHIFPPPAGAGQKPK